MFTFWSTSSVVANCRYYPGISEETKLGRTQTIKVSLTTCSNTTAAVPKWPVELVVLVNVATVLRTDVTQKPRWGRQECHQRSLPKKDTDSLHLPESHTIRRKTVVGGDPQRVRSPRIGVGVLSHLGAREPKLKLYTAYLGKQSIAYCG